MFPEPPASPGVSRQTAARRFTRHFLEMVAAMVVGMVVLLPIAAGFVRLIGDHDLATHPIMAALEMATTMAIGTWVWMRYRHHTTARIAEMIAVVYGSFGVLFVPYWAGLLSGRGLMIGGHLVMLPAMITAMLVRRDDYLRDDYLREPQADAAQV